MRRWRALLVAGLVAFSVTLSAQISLAPTAWTVRYSPGMPTHPSPLVGMAGWFIDLPAPPGSLHYVTTPNRTVFVNGQTLTFSVQIQASADADVAYDTEPANTCVYPAHVRAYLEDRDFKSHPSDDFTRWWSNPIAVEIVDGVWTASTPIALGFWSSVYGTWNQDYPAQWAHALARPSSMGMTFGGGCFFGHGVYMRTGTARVILTSYIIQ